MRARLNVKRGKKGFQTTATPPPEPTVSPDIPIRTGSAAHSSGTTIASRYARYEEVTIPPSLNDATPEEAHKWWSSLSKEQQERFVEIRAAEIGNLDGIPFRVRDEANRKHLASHVDRVRRGDITNEVAIETIKTTEKALSTPGCERSLLVYDLEDGEHARIAVGCGNLEDAEHVTVVVPGYRGQPYRRLTSLIDNTEAVVEEADRWEYRNSGRQSTSAGVAWIGYQTPAFHELASFKRAFLGADALTQFTEGMKTNGIPQVTVIGHSYGGVVTALARTKAPHIRQIVLVGAPGTPLLTNNSDKKVHVIAARADIVSQLQWFTAKKEREVPNVDLHGTGEELNHGHGHYFVPGSPAVRHMGLVITGGTPPTVIRIPRDRDRPVRALIDAARRFAPALPTDKPHRRTVPA